MDQISHVVECNMMSPRTSRVSQEPQYYQHENEAPPSDQQCQQQLPPPSHYEQLVQISVPMQASVPVPPQEIHYQYYEPPMTLNAWTQVNSDELPSVNTEMQYLKAKTKKLEDRLRKQTELLEEYKKSIANKQESATYRILAQADESHSEVEIKINNSSESGDNLISSSTTTTFDHVYEYSGDESFDTSQISSSTMTTLGPRYTQIPTKDFEKISWSSPEVAMGTLLATVYERGVLATHSMPGHLNPDAMKDIIYIVSKKCGISAKEVCDFLPMRVKCSR